MRNVQKDNVSAISCKLDTIIELLEAISLRLNTIVWPIYQPPDSWQPLPPNQPYWAAPYEDDDVNRDAKGGPTLI